MCSARRGGRQRPTRRGAARLRARRSTSPRCSSSAASIGGTGKRLAEADASPCSCRRSCGDRSPAARCAGCSRRAHAAPGRGLEDAPCAFDAAVYPSVVVASRGTPTAPTTPGTTVTARRRTLDVEWRVGPDALRLDRDDAASPWLLLPPDVRRAFDQLRGCGPPLGTGTLGRATLGVKCGCNDAFVVTRDGRHGRAGNGGASGTNGRAGTLRSCGPCCAATPCRRGGHRSPTRAIIWTHDSGGAPLPSLPSGAARWLAPWRRRLRARADLRGAGVWWTLFRTEAADCSRTRVVWSDFGRRTARGHPAGRRPHRAAQQLLCRRLRRSRGCAHARRTAQRSRRGGVAQRGGGAGTRGLAPLPGVDGDAAPAAARLAPSPRHPRAPR